MSGSIWDHLEPRRRAVEDALAAAVADRDWPPPLREAMAYSLLAPGKRLRPLLTLLACEAMGAGFRQAVPACCAVELVHTYSLIHDDLPAMDDDDLRRGLPTCHKKFGEALAILAGDALLTLAFEVLATGYEPKTAAVSSAELAAAAGAAGMVGGQVLDLTSPSMAIDGLEDIHRRKTGALFRAALRLGVYAARETTGDEGPHVLEVIDRYAAAFGLAFQVTDDLLDAEGTDDKAGKRVGKDAARGKLTYPGLLGVEASRRKAMELGQEAVTAAGRLGPGGQPLADLARYVVNRDR
ncbi:MAG TPA: farnesyl diphosphate synthase [Fimbriiglobus sp.]|nr:farnesyl diphosphate synthase [Fimbriiglobus sp.]